MTVVTSSLLEVLRHGRMARFWKECRSVWDESPGGGASIKRMIEQAVDVPPDDFVKQVDLASWPGASGYDDPLEAFADDYSTRFCKSRVNDSSCYFVQYAGFEIIFLPQ